MLRLETRAATFPGVSIVHVERHRPGEWAEFTPDPAEVLVRRLRWPAREAIQRQRLLHAGIRRDHRPPRIGITTEIVDRLVERPAELLQLLLSNDVSRIEVSGAQYSCLCREDGGVLDDLFTYRLGDHHFLTVTNAANHERDLEWFRRHADDFDADVHDRIDEYAMLAVQGPEARRIVGSIIARW